MVDLLLFSAVRKSFYRFPFRPYNPGGTYLVCFLYLTWVLPLNISCLSFRRYVYYHFPLSGNLFTALCFVHLLWAVLLQLRFCHSYTAGTYCSTSIMEEVRLGNQANNNSRKFPDSLIHWVMLPRADSKSLRVFELSGIRPTKINKSRREPSQTVSVWFPRRTCYQTAHPNSNA